jgi:hypothetical protein
MAQIARVMSLQMEFATVLVTYLLDPLILHGGKETFWISFLLPHNRKTIKEYHTDQESPTEFRRTFFSSIDVSCNNQIDNMKAEDGDTSKANGDSFILPFDACVGPFGPPRPWGWFELVSSIHSYHIDNKI